MIWGVEVILLTFVVITAVGSLWIKDLMSAAIFFGAYSFLMCLVWTGMGAVDVAFTEAAVGAGISTVLIIATIYNTKRITKDSNINLLWKSVAAVIVTIVGFGLMSAINDFPKWGDPLSPANSHVSSYYVEHAYEDSHVPNLVTAVLADYRGFDTMFETAVVFVASISIVVLLRRFKKKRKSAPYDTNNSVIIQTSCRIMVPFMQLFALYVVAHGHHSPGGGFQGGVILGASLILFAISYDIKSTLTKLSEKWMILSSSIGVLIFAGIGFGSMLLGSNFLDYSIWHSLLPGTDEVMARSHGMLGVEIGVALTVMCGMFAIYTHIASDGQMEKGL